MFKGLCATRLEVLHNTTLRPIGMVSAFVCLSIMLRTPVCRENCRSDGDAVCEFNERCSPFDGVRRWRHLANTTDRPIAASGRSTLGGPKSRGPPNLAVLLTHCGQLILRKISKFDAIRCQILRLKCTKFDFRPRPTRELTALPQTPSCI